jgi:aminoglycoside phosphotransferase (APT) family kinase protein
MSHRFTITERPGARPVIEKRGGPAALAREAAALAILAGRPGVPALVSHGTGRLVSSRLPGGPRALAGMTAGDLRRLGALVRALHEARTAGEGGLPWWDAPATDLAGYRRRRADDAARALAGTADAGLPARALQAVPADGDDDPEPFRMLHGDLVEANVVWGPDGPGLVDWEFWRMGDPAEDLAYLVELNRLPDALRAALLAGYDSPPVAARVDGWRALVAADAAGWYRGEGMQAEAAPLLRRARALALSPGPPRPAGRAR